MIQERLRPPDSPRLEPEPKDQNTRHRFRVIWRMLFSPLEAVSGTNRITPMDGMRGYAVLLVFLVHHHSLFGDYLPSHSLAFTLSQAAQDIGYSGVDVFFVLSGFLIYGLLLHKQIPYLTFCRRRIRRLYPTYLCVVCIYVVLSQSRLTVSKVPSSWPEATFYLIANLLFLPGILPMHPLITVAWSLSYEMFFYLSIPALIAVTRMRRWRRLSRCLLFGGLLLVHCIAYRMNILPHIRLGMFIAGILLCEIIDAGWCRPRLSRVGEWGVIACYFAVLAALATFEFSDQRIVFNPHFLNARFAYWTLFLAIVIPAISVYAFQFNGILKAVFNSPPARWLGNMSYSYFLIHGLVLNMVAFVLKRMWPGGLVSTPFFLLLLVTNLFLTVMASLLLFVLVEKPFSLSMPKQQLASNGIDRNTGYSHYAQK